MPSKLWVKCNTPLHLLSKWFDVIFYVPHRMVAIPMINISGALLDSMHVLLSEGKIRKLSKHSELWCPMISMYCSYKHFFFICLPSFVICILICKEAEEDWTMILQTCSLPYRLKYNYLRMHEMELFSCILLIEKE